MLNSRRFVTVLFPMAALAAALNVAGCNGEIGAGGPNSGPGPSPGGSGGSGPPPTVIPGTMEAPSPRLLRQLTLSEYRDTVADLLRITNPDTTSIPPDVAVRGFTTNATGGGIDKNNVDRYESTGSALADRAVAESYAALVPCQTQDMACAGTFIDKFGTRAFRRPVTPEEKTRYLALFDAGLTGGDFKVGVALTINAMLISPHFLMRSELGEDKGGGKFVLTPYEIASALSYTYSGTMPDDLLFASAQSGALATKKEIETQVRRMLLTPRGRARVATFASELVEASRSFVATKDATLFPMLKDAAAATAIVNAMKAEQDAFITNIVFDSTKKFPELFSADYTFVNDRLAAFYGLPAPGTGEKMAKVTLPAGSPRGGLLTMGMFLFGHARADQSSPTQRGHTIRANIFCTEVPPPPDGVDATVKAGPPAQTGRQQIEALTGSGICNACHSLMNPIGFALEGFDAAAQIRTTDHGQPIDATGAINGIGSAPITFNGAKELSAIVAKSEVAQACIASTFYRFARGFDPAQTELDIDTHAPEILGQAFVKGNLDLQELFVQVALQESFSVRRSVEALKK
jgi:hypothetical protein